MTPGPEAGPPWRAVWKSPAPQFGILLLGFWARLQQLGALPIYWDEAFHIYYARAPYLYHQFFTVFPYARWLNVMLIAALQPLGMESLWIARLLSVILSLLTAASAFWVGRWLGGRTTGLLAMALYLVLPFAFFYDRQAMSDPIMAAFGSVGVVFGLRSFKTMALRDALLAGLFVALATLTKFAGVLYLPVFFAGAVLLPVINRKRAIGLALAHAVVCVALFGAVFVVAQGPSGPSANSTGAGNWCHSPLCTGQIDLGKILALPLTNVGLYLDTIPSFYTPMVWLLAVAALIMAARPRRGKVRVLGILGFVLALPYILIADLFPPRYLMFTLMAVVVLAAYGLRRVWEWARAKGSWVGGLSLSASAALIFIPSLTLDGWQALSPLNAPMPAWEHSQYAAGWPGSIAAENIAKGLETLRKPGQRINVLAGGVYLEFYAFWGERLGIVKPTRDVTASTYIPWLIGSDPVCLIDLVPTLPLGETPFGMITRTVGVYDVPGSGAHPEIFHGAAQASLRCVTGSTPELSHKIDAYVFGDPASAAEFYPTVADQLRGFTGPVFLYPGNQLDVLKQQANLGADLRPLGDSWPLDFDSLTAQVAGAAASEPEIRVVEVFEDRGDPSRRVTSWLNANLFPVDVQYSGPVQVLRFLTAADSGKTSERKDVAVLPDLGALVQANILDPILPASRLVRLALTWQPSRTPAIAYKVFAHVFDGQGKLVAQHDAFPQAGFAQTNTWMPSQVVTDRFVIYFPPELAGGVYTIKTGFYDPVSGQRLTTVDGQDSIELGQVTGP